MKYKMKLFFVILMTPCFNTIIKCDSFQRIKSNKDLFLLPKSDQLPKLIHVIVSRHNNSKVHQFIESAKTKLNNTIISRESNDRSVTKNITSIIGYLQRFGYLDHVKRVLFSRMPLHKRIIERFHVFSGFTHNKISSNLMRQNSSHPRSLLKIIPLAIKEFQRFFRIEKTGIFDKATNILMNKPRCGLKDLGEERLLPTFSKLNKGRLRNFMTHEARNGARVKRHSIAGSRWKTTNLTYKITKYPTHFKSSEEKRNLIDEQIAKAFKLWSDVTPLTFTQLASSVPSLDVHIDIRFDRGEHGDGDQFDSYGKVLAHAFFPQYGGDAHFDDDQIWTIGSVTGSNVFMVAAHELGHSLGLDHSDVPNAIMAPIYPPYEENRKLNQDDVRAIQIIYGSKSGNPDVIDLCSSISINAIIEVSPTSILVFKEYHYWKINTEEMKLDSDYPKLIHKTFRSLSGSIDVIFKVPDGSIYFFTNDVCWKYYQFNLSEEYPKKIIDDFPNLPLDVDSIMQMNGYLYAFKNNWYWKYSLQAKNITEGPERIDSTWPGLKGKIDAGLSWMNQSVYFFLGKYYYRYSINLSSSESRSIKTTPPYPRLTSLWWFGCR